MSVSSLEPSTTRKPQLEPLLSSQVQCVLATTLEGQPQQHLMAYASVPDQHCVLMMSFHQTRKVNNILAAEGVSLLWDNRTGNCQDHTEGWCLTAQGQAAIITAVDAEFKSLQHIFLSRNRNLMALAKHPDSVITKIDIEDFFVTLGDQQSYRLTWSVQDNNKAED